jgi:hypothetical protein
MSTKPRVFSHTRQRSLNAVDADLPALWPSFGATNRPRSAHIDHERLLDSCLTLNTNRQPWHRRGVVDRLQGCDCGVRRPNRGPGMARPLGSGRHAHQTGRVRLRHDEPLLLAVTAGLGATRGLRLLATRCVDRKEEA